jgi:myo-inositol-1(or 4)-monophosphatase
VREAGGLVTRYDGSAFAVEDKQILATNGRIHDEMQEILKRT